MAIASAGCTRSQLAARARLAQVLACGVVSDIICAINEIPTMNDACNFHDLASTGILAAILVML